MITTVYYNVKREKQDMKLYVQYVNKYKKRHFSEWQKEKTQR